MKGDMPVSIRPHRRGSCEFRVVVKALGVTFRPFAEPCPAITCLEKRSVATSASYIEPAELKRLSVLQSWRTGLALFLDWAAIFTAIAFGIWADHWLAYIVTVFVVAGRQHAIAVLMHDFSHYRFIDNKKVSDWVADLAIAWPLLSTYEGYRRNHIGHHRYLNTDKDPDWALKLGSMEFTFPQEVRFAVLNLLGYLVCISSLRDMRGILKRLNADNPHGRGYKALRAGYYAAIATALTLARTSEPSCVMYAAAAAWRVGPALPTDAPWARMSPTSMARAMPRRP